MKRIITLTSIILPVVAVMFLMSQVIFTNELAGITSELHKLDSQLETLTLENATLGKTVAEESSLSRVQTKAEALGFIAEAKVMTLSDKDFTVAFQRPQ